MHESGYEKNVYLPEPTGRKTPMCCKIALDSDLPTPRSAFLTFPFEAYVDSPGGTQHDQRRLVPSALFPGKSDGLDKWSMFRILTRILLRVLKENPILLQWRNMEKALYNYCVSNLAFSFFCCFFNENYQFLYIYSKPIRS